MQVRFGGNVFDLRLFRDISENDEKDLFYNIFIINFFIII